MNAEGNSRGRLCLQLCLEKESLETEGLEKEGLEKVGLETTH